MLISSRDSLTETPRNDVLPAIWSSLSPVKLIHKINQHRAQVQEDSSRQLVLGRVRRFLKQSRGETTVTARAEVVEREQKAKMGEVGNHPYYPLPCSPSSSQNGLLVGLQTCQACLHTVSLPLQQSSPEVCKSHSFTSTQVPLTTKYKIAPFPHHGTPQFCYLALFFSMALITI